MTRETAQTSNVKRADRLKHHIDYALDCAIRLVSGVQDNVRRFEQRRSQQVQSDPSATRDGRDDYRNPWNRIEY